MVKKLRLLYVFIQTWPLICFGGARHFTFLYEVPTSAPESLELESWITSKHMTGPDRSDGG